jgi:hypothetical protein
MTHPANITDARPRASGIRRVVVYPRGPWILPDAAEEIARAAAGARRLLGYSGPWTLEVMPAENAPPKSRQHAEPVGLLTPAEAARGTAKQAAAILGIKPRKLQAMSQRGEIPGAAKLGRQWTYDLAKLRRYVKQQEKETACQKGARPRPDATGGGIPSGAALRSVGSASGGRLRRMIQQSQKRVGKQAKTER